MNFNFKKFEGRHTHQEDRITITKTETIGFPKKFYTENNISNFKYALLFWDKENMTVGIQFTNDEDDKNKFSILKSKLGYGGSVVARSFFRGNSIEAKKYRGRYEWQKHTIEGIGEIYAVTLKEREN